MDIYIRIWYTPEEYVCDDRLELKGSEDGPATFKQIVAGRGGVVAWWSVVLLLASSRFVVATSAQCVDPAGPRDQ